MAPSAAGRRPRAERGFQRSDSLRRLAEERFDVLVIGGGVTGCGVALDAAARGLRTALVERHDLASGTSSKSSKMVHGGLRYLQQRDFRLVYEALHERQRLLENAPHLVAPLPFLIPLFGRGGVVNKTVARTYSSALWLYDITGGVRIGKRHERLTRAQALEHIPTLKADRLVAAFLYFDARADDARLTLALARTAALDYGAVVANYTDVTGMLRNGSGHVHGAAATAAAFDGGQPLELEIQAAVVVNATGVWADDVRALDEAAHPHSIRPAKGIHVTVPRGRLPADIAAVVPVRNDARSIFVVPWPDGDDVYLGTTDTAWDGPLDDPACLPEDVDYVLAAANDATTSSLTREDVTGVWVGLRPLLSPVDGREVSERTADLSRRHTVRTSAGGVVTVTGGKLTTYRRMAEDAVDAAVQSIAAAGGALPAGAQRCPTKRLRLIGSPSGKDGLGALGDARAAARAGLGEDVLQALVRRHGTETEQVLAMADGRPELLEPMVPGLPHLLVEARWAAEEEMAMTVDDVLSRRTRAVLRRAEAAAAAAEDAADGSLSAVLDDVWGRGPSRVRADAAGFAASARAVLGRAGIPAGAGLGSGGLGSGVLGSGELGPAAPVSGLPGASTAAGADGAP